MTNKYNIQKGINFPFKVFLEDDSATKQAIT